MAFYQHERVYYAHEIDQLLAEPDMNNFLWYHTKANRYHPSIEYASIPCGYDVEATSMKIRVKKHGKVNRSLKTRNKGKKVYIEDDYEEQEVAFVYWHTIGINGYIIFCRTWEQYEMVMHKIVKHYDLSNERRMVFYVHNYAYDAQFQMPHHEWLETFALDPHRPVKCCTIDGLEFRCSYILSGMSLEKMGETIRQFPVRKMVGDLDYDKVRHPFTELTPEEKKYCENDVRVIMSFIYDKIAEEGYNITKVLLTKTGYVRRYCKQRTIHNPDKAVAADYRRRIAQQTLDVDEYLLAKEAFQGGFTHGNPMYVDATLGGDQPDEFIHSIDFTSSYPASMIAFPYPCSKGIKREIKTKKEFEHWTTTGLSMFRIGFKNLILKSTSPDAIISLSKCYDENGYELHEDGNGNIKAKHSKTEDRQILVNNGRVVMVDGWIYTTITNIDLESIKQFYDYDDYRLQDFWWYRSDYLPTAFVKCIIDMYKKKTELKGVAGMEFEYQWHKANLNATYGMAVTDICSEDIEFDEDFYMDADKDLWTKHKNSREDIQEKIWAYNSSNSRFLNYMWGVFITAYSRRNLYTGILEFGDDYIYSDTDSIKCRHIEKHMDYINKYNDWIVKQLETACKHHLINPDDIKPKDIKGVEHPLGVWDWETENAPYYCFKTLGAKRYLVLQAITDKDLKKFEEKHGHPMRLGIDCIDFEGHPAEYHMTVAGLPKKCIDNLVKKYDNLMESFQNELYVDENDANKMLLKYYDGCEIEGDIVDYNGETGHYHEKAYVFMEKTSFEFSRSAAFVNYLKGIRTFKDYS